jgi:hypothetical protein
MRIFHPISDMLDSNLMKTIILKTLQKPSQNKVDKCIYLIGLAILNNKSKWIKEEKVLDILNELSGDFDIPALKWIKDKLDMGDNSETDKKSANEQNDRKRRAMAMRAKLMEKMKSQTKAVIDKNPEYFASKLENNQGA